MIDLTASQVSEAVGGVLTGSPRDRITSVVTDSRQVKAGSLFFALSGHNVDGHDFVAQALTAGAAAAVVTEEVENVGPQIVVTDTIRALGDLAAAHLRRLREANPLLKVVAITGSVGKTSTKDLLSQVLTPLGEVIAPKGSFNNEIGLPMTVFDANSATRVLVLEMGADAPGNLTYLTSIAPPDIAVVLGVGRAHLEGLGSIAGVAKAKQEILRGIQPGGIAILNADDAFVADMAQTPGLEHVILFGETDRADIRATNIGADDDSRPYFTVILADEVVSVRLAVTGEHQVTNALAAICVAHALDLGVRNISLSLAVAQPLSASRMHVIDTPAGVRVIDDAYNANPDSMRAALKTLADMSARSGRRSVAVLGEMLELGIDTITEHGAIGRLVVRLNITRLLSVGNGTRALHSGAYQEGTSGDEASHVSTIVEAREWLLGELQDGDIVLFKSSNGAGLAKLAEQIINDLSTETGGGTK